MISANEHTIGGRIRQARQEKNMKMKELAEKLQITPNYLGLLERGKKQPPKRMLERISEVTGVSYDLLLKGQEEAPRKKKSAPYPRHTVASVDLKLLLPMLMSNLKYDKRLIAQFMDIEPADVDNITSGGDFRFDPTWDKVLSVLTQRMDLDALLEELHELTVFLCEQREEKNDWKLVDILERYINKNYDTQYQLKDPRPCFDDYPIDLIENSPEYVFPRWVSTESETDERLVFVYYSPYSYCPADEQGLEAALRSKGRVDGTKLSIMLCDADSYHRFCTCYKTLCDADASAVASIVSIIHVDMDTMEILDVFTPDSGEPSQDETPDDLSQ